MKLIHQRHEVVVHEPHRQVLVDHTLCFYCGACVAICPSNSMFLENVQLTINEGSCKQCERCVKVCPVHALKMVEK